MSVFYENDCVSCPQGCIGCSRWNDYPVWECDLCHENTTEEDEFIHEDGKDYCPKCYIEQLDTNEIADYLDSMISDYKVGTLERYIMERAAIDLSNKIN